jgi:hypothetical protein
MRLLLACVVLSVASSASADPGVIDPSAVLFSSRPVRDPWQLSWTSRGEEVVPAIAPRPLAFLSAALQQDGAQPLHTAAIEHSHGYQTRAKIHKYASFATLPLFAAEVALGQSLYNTPANAGSRRGLHAAIGSGIVGLFGVNTVTGAWNLFGEGWSDRDGRTLRLVHGLLMMAADVGFLAASATGPNSEGRRGALTFETDKVTHRNIAIASISVGTAGYLLMLLGNH